MAKIGLKHFVAGLLDESGDTPEYTDGMIIGKAITANLSLEIAQAILYADDGIAETVKEFKQGTVSMDVDDLIYAAQGMLFGHTVTDTTLIANKNDVAPYVGVGFYGKVIRGGVENYRAVILKKCKFGVPNDETKTKGENIEFTTPTIEGTVIPLDDGDWKEEQLFTTEAAAETWLDTELGIIEPE
jgi:phi13 family phage major tail protein